MRIKIICGNWKMNTEREEAIKLASEVEKNLPQGRAEVVVCPPFPYLEAVRKVVKKVKLGAQNCYSQEKGAFTGEVSPIQIKELCEYVILGHSERRRYQKETDEEISLKVKAALSADLAPIICVGETKEERDNGKENEVVTQQVSTVIKDLKEDEILKLIFAYEPVWAIGTGEVCDPTSASLVIKTIRDVIDNKGDSISQNISIIYGGSVNSSNINNFAKAEEIDGVLPGGASLKPDEFIKIIEAYK